MRVPTLCLALVSAAILTAGGATVPLSHGGHPVMADTEHSQRAALNQVFDKLGLDVGQRGEMTRAHDDYAAEMARTRPMLHDARVKVARAIHAETFDERALRDAAAEYSALQTEQWVALGRMVAEIQEVLTPEQLDALMQMHEVTSTFLEDSGFPHPGH